ncbi:hypothetical protein EK21DRAFT_118855 [Setomelanomma holmii]|uniref:Ubiquitin-like protease family profile domain-containing protein n=1 Tax=Setomelanomma holmii TaxID=210430 RepID=A0A9P4GX59_9PLEO|nr:hypothetical protein EK21DRAFT_118855 [Setomelanomma holmii]
MTLQVSHIEKTLDDLPIVASPEKRLRNILRDLARDRLTNKERTKALDALEHRALQAGHLLGLIDVESEHYRPATKFSTTTNQVIKAVTETKVLWGDNFYEGLQRADIFLPTRLSRDSAFALRNIAKKYTIAAFRSVIEPILMQQRPAGKRQETVPLVGRRVVQTQDLKLAQIALEDSRRNSLPSVRDVKPELEESLVDGRASDDNDDNDVERPRGMNVANAHSSPPPSFYLDVHSSYPSSISDHGDHDIDNATSSHDFSDPKTKSCITALQTSVYPELNTGANKRKCQYHHLDQRTLKLQRPSDPASGPLQEDTTTLIHDLAPEKRLHGGSVDKLIKTFLPTSLIRIVETQSSERIRETISKSMRRYGSLANNGSLIANVCTNNHWIGCLYDGKCNTIGLIDSRINTVATEKSDVWVHHVSSGLVDTGLKRPTHITHEIAQQTNTWDCGLYLAVSVIRAFALKSSESGSLSLADPIDGEFYRAVFISHFTPGSVSFIDTLAGCGKTQGSAGVDISIRLTRSKADYAALKSYRISSQSALDLFTRLSDVLDRVHTQLEGDHKRFNALVLTLAESQSVAKEYDRDWVANIDDAAYTAFRDRARANLSKIECRIFDTQRAAASTKDLIGLLATLNVALDVRLAEALRAVHEAIEDARCERNEAEEELKTITARMMDLQKRTYELNQVLAEV